MKRLLLLALLAACGKESAKPAPAPAPSPAPAPAPAPAPSPAAAPAPPPPAAPSTALRSRTGGPSVEMCEKAADHLKELFLKIDPGSTEAQLAYGRKLLDENRENVVRYCLEVAAVPEIECVLAAKETNGLTGCERKRRSVDEKLATATELTEADCIRFFDRLRQFKVAEGVKPEDVDRDRDQVIRACQEKANPGTVACFIASPTYEQARRCP